MALVRFEPFRDIISMQRQMNRLFEQMLSMPEDGESISSGMAFVPAAELQETDDAIKLRMELPGISASDLDVKVTANAVAIAGERKFESQQEEKGIHRSEFRYGGFQRVIPLPVNVQNDKVGAEFKDGILCLTLPKAEHEKQRVVSVNLLGQQGGSQAQQLEGKPQAEQTIAEHPQ